VALDAAAAAQVLLMHSVRHAIGTGIRDFRLPDKKPGGGRCKPVVKQIALRPDRWRQFYGSSRLERGRWPNSAGPGSQRLDALVTISCPYTMVVTSRPWRQQPSGKEHPQERHFAAMPDVQTCLVIGLGVEWSA